MNELLKVKIELLKDVPGVYIMKNSEGTVIYVGKAKSLIKRVKQYFFRPQEGKVKRMVREIADFDTIQINSEKEAFLLELNLIQKYYPKYNILLKDGKTYPYISLSKDDEPILKLAYKPNDKKKYYFGPYTSTSSARKTIDLLNQIFPLRKCNSIPNSPCLYYHLNQCLGPCINQNLKEKYRVMVDNIKHFMNGDDDNKIRHGIQEKMRLAAEELNFEKAQEYKNILQAIDHIQEKQAIALQDKTDMDVIASSTREGYFSLSIIMYRHGLLIGKNIFILEQEDDFLEQLLLLLFQYYQKHELPKEIIVGNDSWAEGINESLDVKVIVPSRGIKKDLLLIALENAKNGLDEHFLSARLEDDNLVLLEKLGQILHIKTPLHIELFDNSHLQGSEPIGAMVCFINGVKTPSMYRKYNISHSDGKDDLKSMYEIVYRRYSRLVSEGQKLPDLVLVDGGLNQINVAKRALIDAGASEVNLAGLAKDDHHHTSLLLSEDEAFPLNNQDKLFLLLVRMQDEVHRFAITFHRSKRSKKILTSFFDDIPGIGQKRKEILNKTYPSLESLSNTTIEELMQIVPKACAIDILKKLNENK